MNVDNFCTKIDIIHIFRHVLCNLPDGRLYLFFFDKITVAHFFTSLLHWHLDLPAFVAHIEKKPAEP